MNWRIEEKEAFEVFGIERIFNNEDTGLVPSFWDETAENGSRLKLPETHGLCDYRETEKGTFPYMIFAYKKEGRNTEGYTSAIVPKNTWAVFRIDGLRDHEDCQVPYLFQRAYGEWLPSSGYDKAKGPDMEIYGEDFEEVWIPVVKR